MYKISSKHGKALLTSLLSLILIPTMLTSLANAASSKLTRNDVKIISGAIGTGLTTGSLVLFGTQPNIIQVDNSVETMAVPLGVRIFQSGNDWCVSDKTWASLNGHLIKSVDSCASPTLLTINGLGAPIFTLSSSSQTAYTNVVMVGFSIASNSLSTGVFSITPAVPSGLSFNASTGVLSGIPTVASQATIYTVSETDPGNSLSSTQTFTLTVLAQTAPTSTSTLTAIARDSQNVLNWSAVSSAPIDPVSGYVLQQGTSATGPWATVYTGTALTYTDSGLTDGTAYYYQIAAYNSVGTGTYSASVESTPAVLETAAPSTSPIISSLNHNLSLGSLITYSAVADTTIAPVAGYYLQSATTTEGPWTTLVTQPAIASIQSGTGNYGGFFPAGSGTTTYYRAAAYNAIGTGPYSAAFVDIWPPLLQPEALTVTSVFVGGVNLYASYNTLNGPATNAYLTSAILSYATSPTGPWTVYTSFASDYSPGGNIMVTGLVSGTTYYFKDNNQNTDYILGLDSPIISVTIL